MDIGGYLTSEFCMQALQSMLLPLGLQRYRLCYSQSDLFHRYLSLICGGPPTSAHERSFFVSISRASFGQYFSSPKTCHEHEKLRKLTCQQSQLQNWVGAVNYWVLKADF
jgi:hypothetical protein